MNPSAIKLFFLSAAALLLELTVIRFHSGNIPLLALLKNISLLSCFFGLGLGMLSTKRTSLTIAYSLAGVACQVVLLTLVVRLGYHRWWINPIAEELSVGIVWFLNLPAAAASIALIAIMSVWTASLFIPIGEEIAHTLRELPSLYGYRLNLLGSAAGTLLTAAIGALWLSPLAAIILVFLCFLPSLLDNRQQLAKSIVAFIVIVVTLEYRNRVDSWTLHSPYQNLEIRFSADGPPLVEANRFYFQNMHRFSGASVVPGTEKIKAYYDLPYQLRPHARSALIVGAGTGNDVAAALRAGVPSVTAVEIDPAILALGRALHPDRPYQSERVNAIVDDARSYFRSSTKKYDMVVFGLLDAHAAVAGKSSLRLDSYVYTVEAFIEARRLLSEGGTLVLAFVHLGDPTVKKFAKMLEAAFNGMPPRVLQTEYDGGVTLVAGSIPESSHAMSFEDITDRILSNDTEISLSTDDWPFLYMPKRIFPWSYLFLFSVVAAFFFVLVYSRRHSGIVTGLYPAPFFLGAAFMLLQAKAITEASLLFGNVFSVVTLVILVTLTLALLANILREKKLVLPSAVSFLLLLCSLGVGYVLTWLPAFGIPVAAEAALRSLVLMIPVFFAGLIFSDGLSKLSGEQISIYLGSNLLGALFGGILEYVSLYSGCRVLYMLAAGLYVLAWMSFHWRRVQSIPR